MGPLLSVIMLGLVLLTAWAAKAEDHTFSFDGRTGSVSINGKEVHDVGHLERVHVERVHAHGEEFYHGYMYSLSIVFTHGRRIEVCTLRDDKETFGKADAIGETMGVPVTWWRSKGQEGQG